MDAKLEHLPAANFDAKPEFRVFFLGDMALQVRAVGILPSPDLSQKLQALTQYLRPLPFVSAAICAFDSVTLMLQPYADAKFALLQVQSALTQEFTRTLQSHSRAHLIRFSRTPLTAEFQSDLAALAAYTKCSEFDWLAQFCATTFTVAMIGFKPGFPYLLGLPEALAMPRLATPRISVAKGSVAIGGHYAGIYPARSAGGWHVVGITNTILFDVRAPKPCLFAAGDSVRFEILDSAV
jgi:KipI family sensor histidine kinase inhibitor